MTLRLSELVPNDRDSYYYHEETGLLLGNNPEYGWVAVTSFEKLKAEYDELTDAIERAEADGGIADTGDVLPLPDDYDGERHPPEWKQ